MDDDRARHPVLEVPREVAGDEHLAGLVEAVGGGGHLERAHRDLAGHLAVVVGGCLALGVGYGLAMPGFQSSASLAVGPAEQGAAAGLVSAAMALGFVIGPILGTSLYYAEPRLPFIAAAALCLGLLGAVTATRHATPVQGAR